LPQLWPLTLILTAGLIWIKIDSILILRKKKIQAIQI